MSNIWSNVLSFAGVGKKCSHIAGVGNNLVATSQERLAAFAVAVIDYNVLMETACLLPETDFHASRKCIPRSEENKSLQSFPDLYDNETVDMLNFLL